MLGLLVSLVLLGLSAVDPIGIAAMPLLLTQKNPFVRSAIFLAGSFLALIVMGLIFAQGIGSIVLRFETEHAWLIPGIEVVAGAVLLGVAGTLFWQLRTKRVPVDKLSRAVMKQLRISNGQLFAFSAGLVAIQSILDVVFIVAMIRAGRLHLPDIELGIAIAAFAIAALLLQLVIVIAYALTPIRRRKRMLTRVNKLLTSYANQTVMIISLLIGSALLINGTLGITGVAHL